MSVAIIPAPAISVASDSASPVEESVRLTFVDGTTVISEWLGFGESAAMRVRYRDGTGIREAPLDALMSLDFASADISPQGDVTYYLADGGMMIGELLGGSTDRVYARTSASEYLELPFDRLAAIQFTSRSRFEAAGELFQEALASRLPGQDVLITRSVEEARMLRGRVERLSAPPGELTESDEADSGVFDIGGRPRTFVLRKMYGIVFAAGAANPPVYGASFTLADGSRFYGWVRGGSERSIRCATSFGSEWDLPLASLRRIELFSDRVKWLSDLTPVSERQEGLLSQPWPWRRDLSVSGRPLSLDGRVFPRGLGVRARSELTFDLAGQYSCFAATVGIDDAVRPRGHVVFRVSGDDRVLFDSGPITGRDRAREFAVDVTGVRRLTLLVDFGDELDLSDHADWAHARLLKKNPDGSHPCARP